MVKYGFNKRLLLGIVALAGIGYGSWYLWVGDHEWRNREILRYDRSVRFLSADFETLENAFKEWGQSFNSTGVSYASFSDNKLKLEGTFAQKDSSVRSPEAGNQETEYFWNGFSCDLFYSQDRVVPSKFRLEIFPPHGEKVPRLSSQLASAILANLVDGSAAFQWEELSVTVSTTLDGQQAVTLTGTWPPPFVEKSEYRYDQKALDRYRDQLIPVAFEISRMSAETGRVLWPCITRSSSELILSSRQDTTWMTVSQSDYPFFTKSGLDDQSVPKGNWLRAREQRSRGGGESGEYVERVTRRNRVYHERDGLWVLEFSADDLDTSVDMLQFRLRPVGLFERFQHPRVLVQLGSGLEK